MSKYKIVFVSTEIPPHHRERVKANLSVVFRKPVAALAPLFQDRPVTIKQNLGLVEANRYRDVVQREGGICRVEPMSEGTSSISMTIESPPVVADSGIVTCPRCATRQKRAPICSGCGVILQNFDQEIRVAKAKQTWKQGDLDRRKNKLDRRIAQDRRGELRFQDDRRSGSERRADVAGWHRNRDAFRA